jgi:FtsP/CotA-like multicopper oxidase with cupredoxin domain
MILSGMGPSAVNAHHPSDVVAGGPPSAWTTITSFIGGLLWDGSEAPPARHPSGHEGSEGLRLASAHASETVVRGPRCPATAPVRTYGIVAINVEITLNRYLDHDPNGQMYILEEDLPRLRQEEAQNREARTSPADPAVSLGLQGDAIQPLVLRVNQGECLRIALRNDLKGAEPASLHLHGSGLYLAETGGPAIATNRDALIRPGEGVTYEWWVAEDEPEGTHYFHSHGSTRRQSAHGLFGAVIVEPRGSRHLDPIRGTQLSSGWAAMIVPLQGSHFREFVIFYHEVGHERYRLLDSAGAPVAQVDPFTSAYRPGARAINYRSEPFMNRLALQQRATGRYDKSQAYSSYVFGDPATPIARSYLGDPVKERIVHGGSEVLHVHHVHGGAIRWRRQPQVEPSRFGRGLDKTPPLTPRATERVDSQAIGPSESYDVEHECGSGGCQQGAGDYLVHCHVAHHYIAGMWMIWRVYNTKQDGTVSLDGLPPLQELPARLGYVLPGVTSERLIGQLLDWKGKTYQVTRENLAAWVERQLPPSGVPKGDDASVLDWRREGDLYLNEPEPDQVWPGFHPLAPGTRLPISFDPKTGKLAYPFLRPHLGKRPPFAPHHGPAPFLDPTLGVEPPRPGEHGPWSLCPEGTRVREFAMHAITVPIILNRKASLMDPVGQLYVLKEQEEAIRRDERLRVPLAIRANAGEDCVDIIFKSELPDSRQNGFLSKANVHIHFAQFDIQASDGVNTGFNYEQSIRPFSVEGERLTQASAAGASKVRVTSAERFHPGILVGVGMDQDRTFEIKRIKAITGELLIFDDPLRHAHADGEIVSAEFVRYRWFPDVQFGTAYFHDHVDALTSWRHGLFGALIAEPPSSTYHHPQTGEALKSGPVADIHTHARVSADVAGSFRELVLFIQDDNPLTRLGDSTGGSFNLRVEPLAPQGGTPPHVSLGQAHSDPETPMLEAFVGDPIVIRALVAGTNEVHSLHVDGHWFRAEPWSETSPPISTIPIGISERYDLVIPRAGGPQRLPGNYLYYSGRSSKLLEGNWGIIRVYDGAAETSLKRLPSREPARGSPLVCPGSASRKEFAITALEAPLPMLRGARGKLYVLQDDKAAVRSGTKVPEPLVLRVNVGDCVVIHLTNETSGPVSFHASELAYNPHELPVIAPDQTRTYTYFAHPEVGETAVLVRDGANVLENPALGLYGAIIVGARGARYRHPVSGEAMSVKAGWRADVFPPSDRPYRDFALFIQDQDEVIGTAVMPYTEHVKGVVGLNYQAEPLRERLATAEKPSKMFGSQVVGDPGTPILEAFVGDPVKLHVFFPWSEQAHVFSLEGHRWPLEPGRQGSTLLSSILVGGMQALTLTLAEGAGGPGGLPGHYLYGDHREPYREAGLWGIFRVHAPHATATRLRPLRPSFPDE